MRMKRFLTSGVIGGVLATVFVLMQLAFPNPSFQVILAPSFLREQSAYPIVLFGMFWVIVTLLTHSYHLIDFRLSGSKNFKAILFVVSEMLIILLYVSEPLPHRVDLDWLLNPLKLCVLFLIQGKAIQLFMARERLKQLPKPFFYTRGLLIYMITFSLFRMVTYVGFGGYQMDSQHVGLSLFWALTMGLAIGLAFSALQRFFIRQDRKGKAQCFTFGFFALMSVGYHLFMILTYDVSWGDMFMRCCLDILAVWLATTLILYFQIDEKAPLSPRPLDGEG